MIIDPFKLKIEGRDALEMAENVFGRAGDVSFSTNSAQFNWFLYEDGFEINLEMAHLSGSDTLKINLRVTRIHEDMTICAKRSAGTLGKIKNFIDEIKKPWVEWEEDEILSSLMWICLYKEDGNKPTPAMESRMVMESYRDPKDQWIKRYFGVSNK